MTEFASLKNKRGALVVNKAFLFQAAYLKESKSASVTMIVGPEVQEPILCDGVSPKDWTQFEWELQAGYFKYATPAQESSA